MKKKKIFIIGGGAAGFFCAANLDETKFEVSILEQNAAVLQKVKISGGGRCNVSHACFDPKELTQFYPRGNKELLSVFHSFQPGDTMEWFQSRGADLKIETDQRIFPQSNSSQTIINTLVEEVGRKNFTVNTKCAVTNIEKISEGFSIETTSGNYLADEVIYTTGSAPKSVKLLAKLGHKIVDAVPSLFTFNIKNELLADLMGTSFPQAIVRLPELKTEESGPLLITHWGLSGPAILKISAWKARELFALNYKFSLIVNFLGIHIDDAKEIFQEFRIVNGKKQIGSAKPFDITNRFWHKILWYSDVAPTKTIASLTSKEMDRILKSLCENEMKVQGKSTYKDEFVTAGGVELKEIDFRTMKSKVVENLYIAGEVLNIDAITGGFNFQACWSEAWLIAQHLNNDDE